LVVQELCVRFLESWIRQPGRYQPAGKTGVEGFHIATFSSFTNGKKLEMRQAVIHTNSLIKSTKIDYNYLFWRK
jgi:hypothetical protein